MAWGDNTQGPWGTEKPKAPKNSGGGGTPPDFDELLKKGKEQFDGIFGGGGDKKTILIALLVLFLFWLSTGFYEVDASEEGIVLRFGEYQRSVGSGLHYRAPYPFEKVTILNVTEYNRVEIGQRSTGRSQVREVLEESSMITGDENIIDVPFEVQWFINDAKSFLFNIRDPENTVKSVAESAMREVIGRTDIKDAISAGKSKLSKDAKKLMQRILDEYEAGITIAALELREVRYPKAVRGAFTDVQNAKTEAESAINQAEAYRNDIIPRARGKASQIVHDAQAYKEQVIAKAQGEAGRFTSVYDKYKVAKDVTIKRMYLETMEEVLTNTDKIIIDKNASNGMVPYLPLNEIKKK